MSDNLLLHFDTRPIKLITVFVFACMCESSVHGVCLPERWLSLKMLLMESRNILCYKTTFQSLLLSLGAVPKTAWEGWEEQEFVPVQQESGEGSREMLGQSWDCAGWAPCIKGDPCTHGCHLWWARIQQPETLKSQYFTWKKKDFQ